MEGCKQEAKTMPRHALIVGEQGVGKSTLVRRVLEALDVSLCGYQTRKEDDLADPQLGSPIYIYQIGEPVEHTGENLVGHCKDQRPQVYPEGFDRFAPKVQQMKQTDKDLILLDELGIMEMRSQMFCQVVLELLDGDTPILAVVKYKDRPFLNQVRSHERCHCFEITRENRETLWLDVLAFVKQQLEGVSQ